jgi:hypothetical protein
VRPGQRGVGAADHTVDQLGLIVLTGRLGARRQRQKQHTRSKHIVRGRPIAAPVRRCRGALQRLERGWLEGTRRACNALPQGYCPIFGVKENIVGPQSPMGHTQAVQLAQSIQQLRDDHLGDPALVRHAATAQKIRQRTAGGPVEDNGEPGLNRSDRRNPRTRSSCCSCRAGRPLAYGGRAHGDRRPRRRASAPCRHRRPIPRPAVEGRQTGAEIDLDAAVPLDPAAA